MTDMSDRFGYSIGYSGVQSPGLIGGVAMRDKGEGSIFQRSDGMWIGRVELPPGPKGTRRRAQVARKKKSEVIDEMRKMRGDLEKAGDLATTSQTLEQWVTYWLDNVKAGHVRPRTLDTYRGQAKWIIESIGTVTLRKLTPAHVHQLHRDALAKVSSKYAREIHGVLSMALEDAVRQGRATRNVAKLVDPPEKNTTSLEALSVDEAIRVLAACVPALKAKPYDPTPVLWAVYLLTGMRRGELLGLEWDRVGDVLDVSWQLQFIPDIDRAPASFERRRVEGKLYLVRPKTKAGYREIPVVEPLGALLTAHRERSGGNGHGLVFTRSDGRAFDPVDISDLWKAWRKAVTSKPVRLHDLRHTTVDLLYEANVPEDVIVEIVGHSMISMSRQYKARGNRRRNTEAMRSLSTLLGH
jgi:integrase